MFSSELLPITKEIYSQMQSIAWLLIGPMFLLSCTIHYVKEPANFPALEMIQRIVITIALLIFFPQITSTIASIANALAERIGDRSAIDSLFQKVQDQSKPDNQSTKFPFLLSMDMWVAALNFLSYSVVYIFKYLIVAL
jgi:hypothetical protein